MKCDDCVNLLETYLDGEATERESDQIQTHLATCSMCANKPAIHSPKPGLDFDSAWRSSRAIRAATPFQSAGDISISRS